MRGIIVIVSYYNGTHIGYKKRMFLLNFYQAKCSNATLGLHFN
uniref:Uncharacterized protein n=1 Tax=Anguilla anguilla TaxID=7936 RepID=A0A0E9QVV2_ANGAN